MTTWLLSFLIITILTYSIKGSDSNTNEWSSEHNQPLDSSLTGTIHELVSVDDNADIDTALRPSLDRLNLEPPVIEGYRLANNQKNVFSPSLSLFDEVLLERHKRDVTDDFDLLSTLSMDGSGTVTDEDSTTDTTNPTTTVQLNFTSSTDTLATFPVDSTSTLSTTEGFTDNISNETSYTTGLTILATTITAESISTELYTQLANSTESPIIVTTIPIYSTSATNVPSTIFDTTESTSSTYIASTTRLTTEQYTSETTTTLKPQVCTWTNWVPLGNCTPNCGIAYRTEIRSCIDLTTGLSCASSFCGGGSATQNASCVSSPPCETLILTPQPSSRDPAVRIIPYTLPDKMYFFQQTYRRIWISNKGYITFDTPFYGQKMTTNAFRQISNQAIAAPFWTNLLYDNTSSTMTINWFSSTNASGSDASTYYNVIQSAIQSACPTASCPINYAVFRVVRINWQNLIYELPYVNQSITVSFSAYLINTYEYDYPLYSYPLLRAYFAFDYSNLPSSLNSLRPFVGYRDKNNVLQILNDPSYYQNAAFLVGRQRRSFYVGSRFLSECEVSFLQESTINILRPSENLNDIITNPRFPCPCILGQAQIDARFIRLFSETQYEIAHNVICYAPMTTNRIRIGWTSKPLRSQTCCYNWRNGGLITSGYFAGSVLSNPLILFQRISRLRRIPFYDQCCSPSSSNGMPNWETCRFYYQLHPPSSCTGYRSPFMVTGAGDPHVNTIDNGRYTCHIQGGYIFARTNAEAKRRADANENGNAADINLIYPDDLFEIQVRSVFLAPALSYIERTQGYGSVFSSYTIIANSFIFIINNNNGKFNFTVNDGLSLTDALTNNLDYDYSNVNYTNTNITEQYIYRVTQTGRSVLNRTVPQLTLTLWSGLAIRCEIIGENLECILSLPQKFRTYIEGLSGNFNGDPNDDLSDRQTNQTIPILTLANATSSNNDADVLRACKSWKVSTETIQDTRSPIMPMNFVNWYYNEGSAILANLHPSLSQAVVNQTCSAQFECIHDYLIRINPFTSQATASTLDMVQESIIIINEAPPTDNLTLPIQITLPSNASNRNYLLGIDVMPGAGTNIISVMAFISTNSTKQNITIQNSMIPILIPSDANSFVEVFVSIIDCRKLSIKYGANSTSERNLDIVACLCNIPDACNFQQTIEITPYYNRALCDCPPQYDGDLCEKPYDGCTSGDGCTVNWKNGTSCVPLSPSEQLNQSYSYYCNGTCRDGYNSTNGYTCEDIDECQIDPTRCGNGVCKNTEGWYTCNCSSGYRFNDTICININECSEPNIDGSYPRRCADEEVCRDTVGNYTCECSSIFNTTGNCTFNASLCNNATCTGSDGTLVCLNGTINMNNNTCIPWCSSTCPGFCEVMNGFYQCNCLKYPGFEYSDDGQQCIQCRAENYGYGCKESCDCGYGICNRNATNVNQSCICNPGYQPPFCHSPIDACATNSSCDGSTQDCKQDEQNNKAICSCKAGYEQDNITQLCTDINECAKKPDYCDSKSSSCQNTNGGYNCSCNAGFQSLGNQLCEDIDECTESSKSCANYSNTYCVNIPGAYECRCSNGYSVGGDPTQTFQNIRDTNKFCLLTNLSVYCENACNSPASCNSNNGRCTCPTILDLVTSSDPTKQTCQCPGHPFVTYTNQTCDSSIGQTWFLVNFNQSLRARFITMYSSQKSIQPSEISNILSKLNKTCDASCVQINQINNTDEYFVALDIPLNATERLQFVNEFYKNYNGTIRIIINEQTKKLETFTTSQKPCRECDLLDRGSCTTESEDACRCWSGFEGYLCRITSVTPQPSLQTPQTTSWIIIVAIISSIAGLLLIIAFFMCMLRIISHRRKSTSRKINQSVVHGGYYIPRAHVPAMGTGGARNIFTRDGFSINTSNDRYNDTSYSDPSSSTTTYNPTYSTNRLAEPPVFTIFDNLDKRTQLPKGSIPRTQIVGMSNTLNSFPQNRLDDPEGTFLDSNDLNEVELVTDMVEDMTKDDNISDDFIEATNPYVILPRTPTQAPGRFSFFGYP